MTWVVVPAAGRGERVGAEVAKQYLRIAGDSIIGHTLKRLAAQPLISGLVVVLAADDALWPGWSELRGKPVLTAEGGAKRCDSVLAGLEALPAAVADDALVLVHDAARPCLRSGDVARLIEAARAHAVGALLAAPVADTLKRSDGAGDSEATVPRERLWRALTPQAFRRGELAEALCAARDAGVSVTDEAMAFERLGRFPALVEGAADNIKVTTPADLDLAEFLLQRQAS